MIKVSKTLPADLQILVLAITMNDMEVGRKLVKVLTCNGSGTIDNFVHSLTGPKTYQIITILYFQGKQKAESWDRKSQTKRYEEYME